MMAFSRITRYDTIGNWFDILYNGTMSKGSYIENGIKWVTPPPCHAVEADCKMWFPCFLIAMGVAISCRDNDGFTYGVFRKTFNNGKHYYMVHPRFGARWESYHGDKDVNELVFEAEGCFNNPLTRIILEAAGKL